MIFNEFIRILLEAIEYEGFKNTTDANFYDDIMENPEYFRKNKGLISEVVLMTPREYLEKCAERQRGEWQRTEDNDKLILKYSELMKNGIKFPMVYLDYSHDSFSQEGRHRALAAEKAGIKNIPVLIIRDVEKLKYVGSEWGKRKSNWNYSDALKYAKLTAKKENVDVVFGVMDSRWLIDFFDEDTEENFKYVSNTTKVTADGKVKKI